MQHTINENYMFWVKIKITHAFKTWFLCGLHSMKSLSHTPNFFSLWGLVIKYT